MKSNRPSRTAHLVALGRALADIGLSHVPDFHDPTARFFLNDKGKQSLAKVEQEAGAGRLGVRVRGARRMADMIALRTAAIDAAARSAIAAVAKQLVILGAGYDGRAWRMSELAGVKVFEVDRPATQEDKRARVAELPPPVGVVSFVSIDFERESIDAILATAGHDASVPTCWIWEGVVMYLTREAMHATVAAIARRSAIGSMLIVNYHTAHRGFIGRLILRLIGEPQISDWTPEEIAADLGRVGFAVREDSAMTDWNRRFANGEGKVDRGYYMRIAVAEKASGSC
jgi:methyltransferase (TIGR00027 family)